jgi:hypothetical protein
MPCYKCNNGKYKYGARGRCQFDTLETCHAAEQAIHARENSKKVIDSEDDRCQEHIDPKLQKHNETP